MQWLNDGLKNIWLPYTQMKYRPDPLLPIVSANGCKLKLADGRELIDGISSWWSMCHGYSHPYMIEKMLAQVQKLSHVMFAGCAHEEAYRLANRLVQILPQGLSKVFFSDSGSTAVEVALKMAVQYYYNQNQKSKCKFISFNNAYHGDTAGCMAVSASSIHSETFKQHCSIQYNVPINESLSEFQTLIEQKQSEIAGVIIEPLLQCAGGMKFHSIKTLSNIYEITKKYNILFIADEIATGFYRLGKRFACNFANITPDIITLGKALSGGMCSLGATVATERVFNAFVSDNLENAFMHGPTFMGNPIACAAANASLDLFEENNYVNNIKIIEEQLKQSLEPCIQHSKVQDVRIKGAVAAIEVKADWEQMFQLRKEVVNMGVWIRPFSNIIYLMPPFIITSQELHKLISAVKSLLTLL